MGVGSQWVNHFAEIIGKRIEGLVVARHPDPPRTQVFVVLDDGTHYELFGEDLQGIKGIDPGGFEIVVEQVRKRPEVEILLEAVAPNPS